MSRSSNFARNGAVTLIFFAAMTLLGFFSRKILLNHLGIDLLGLNTTLMAIIDFMLLMELGIAAAIGVSLYKPLAEGDNVKVNQIMWLIIYLYRYLALAIIAVGILLSPLLPFLVEKSTVTLSETYVAYFVFLIGSASAYLFGYGRVLFQADQKNYMPVTITNIVLFVKVIIQIVVVIYTNSYWWWLGIEIIFQVGAQYSLKRIVVDHYPSLNFKPQIPFKTLIKSYSDIFSDAKRIAVHHASGFVLRQSDNIIIASMINLSSVALYGNYAMINIALNGVTYTVLQNGWAGIGNLVATETKGRIYAVYKEYLSANFYAVVVVNLAVLFLVEDFIKVWLGSQYILSYYIVIAFVSTNIVGSLTNATSGFITAYKLFGYLIIPISEAVLNIIVSIIGAYYFGLIGVIGGTFCSLLISAIWKPIYLHRKGILMPLAPFWFHVLRIFGLLAVSLVGIYYVAVLPTRALIGDVTNIGEWMLMAALIFAGICLILGACMYLGDPNFRLFVKRVLSKIKR